MSSSFSGTVACLLGMHVMRPARRLTTHSTEWRCRRDGCTKRAVDYAEPEGPSVMHGSHPYDGLGEVLERKGRQQGVDQIAMLPFREPTPSERTVAAMLDLLDDTGARRAAHLLFLCDWRLALTSGRTMTGLPWRMSSGGPDLDEAVRIVRRLIAVRDDSRTTGRPLDPEEAAAVAHVADVNRDMDHSEIVRLVVSTRPSMRHWHGEVVDLPAEAALQNADRAAAMGESE